MKKVYIETLGCPKNWVESEKLMGDLGEVSVTHNPEEADTIIVNTCGFLQSSRQESIETILGLAEYKKTGECSNLVVSGCLVESHGMELEEELHEVDMFCKTGEYKNLLQLLKTKKKSIDHHDRYFLQNPWSNYLKISEGCNHKCSFCTIPQFKGKLKSRSIEDLVEESKRMAARGVTEISLVGQDLSNYGFDLNGENLSSLLRELVKIRTLKWIRLLYLYPTLVDDELIRVVKNEEKIAKYFDIPVQHLDNQMLKSMNRSGTVESYHELIEKIRGELDRVALRTTLIVGFPGETEERFQTLLSNMKRFKWNHLGAFEYSPEESTKSYHLSDHIDPDTKKARLEQVMELQAQISYDLLEDRVGSTCEGFIEEVIPENDENPAYYIGRSQFEAPEIDGNLVISSLEPIEPGQYIPVKIIKRSDYDLFGVPS